MLRNALSTIFGRVSKPRRASAMRSTLLFARPSFLYGVTKLLDPLRMGEDFNRSRTPQDADLLAIRSDWHAIGADMQQALAHETEALGLQMQRRNRRPAHSFST